MQITRSSSSHFILIEKNKWACIWINPSLSMVITKVSDSCFKAWFSCEIKFLSRGAFLPSKIRIFLWFERNNNKISHRNEVNCSADVVVVVMLCSEGEHDTFWKNGSFSNRNNSLGFLVTILSKTSLCGAFEMVSKIWRICWEFSAVIKLYTTLLFTLDNPL
jgi:hypothetical protein